MNQSFTAQRRQFIAALSSCMLLAAAPIATAQSLTPKASSNKMRELMALGNALAGTQVSDAALVEQYLQVLQEQQTLENKKKRRRRKDACRLRQNL